MAEPFLAEIRMTSFGFPPKGWALCNGQLLPINQNQALFSLLGTTYGGDGRVNFALPDLRGRAPVHFGSEVSLGQRGGAEAVTLQQDHLPAHGHLKATSNQATSATPGGKVLANAPRRGVAAFAAPDGQVVMPGPGPVGGGQAHQNMQPSLALNFVIALQGIFPSRF